MMPGTRAILAAGTVVALLAAGGLAVYGTRPTGGNSVAAGPCRDAAETVARLAPHARGEVAAFNVAESPGPAPDLTFKGPDGGQTSLGAMTGKLLLVNLWATWCAPCKAEMPALDRLQAAMGGKDFDVVAINVDTRNLDKPADWLKQAGITHLPFYADPGGRVLPAVQRHADSAGLPTTLLIDGAGCTIGVMKGGAEWSSPDGLALIRAALGR